MALAFVGRLKRSGADTDLWLRNVSPAALEPIDEISAISRAWRVGVVANAMHRCVAVVRSARSIAAPVAAPGGVASRWHRASACPGRSEEHTSELQSLMRISYAVFCLKKKTIS